MHKVYTFSTTYVALGMANQQDASLHKKTQFTSRNGVLDYCTERHRTGIIVIIIIIITLVIPLCSLYSYVPELNHVYRACRVAAALFLQFMLHVMLFRMLNMLCTFTAALPAVSMQCTIWLFSAVT